MTHTYVRPKRAVATKPQHLSKTQTKIINYQLSKHGFSSYTSYICSDSWFGTKERYRDTPGKIQTCVVCRDPNVDLHHRTYKRLCEEQLNDLVPLCREHHQEIHDKGLDIWRGASELREIFVRGASKPPVTTP